MRDEEELNNIMEQIMDVYERVPDYMQEKMEPVIKITFHIKELSDEFHKIDGDTIFEVTEELKKVDKYLVKAIKAVKEITNEQN